MAQQTTLPCGEFPQSSQEVPRHPSHSAPYPPGTRAPWGLFLGVALLAGCAQAGTQGLIAPTAWREDVQDPGVVETYAVERYAVAGQTMQAVRQGIEALGPVVNGQHFAGRTHYDIHYEYNVLGNSERCALADLHVRLDLRVLLPEFTEASGPTFTDYMQGLTRHEDGHVRVDRHIASALRQAIRAVPPQPDCTAMQAAIRQAGKETLESGNALNVQYDTLTNHGLTQGAANQ